MKVTPSLTPASLETFSSLLEQPYEEPCQHFLRDHSAILLYVFGGRICLPKFRLGAEFETDFMLVNWKSMGLSVTLIELEPPQVKPFNRDGTFSKRLNQAMNQIHDWLAWIERSKAYFLNSVLDAIDAREASCLIYKVEEALSIDAKIVIGRRHHLAQQGERKRQSLYKTSQRLIEITNYDRLLEGGARLYAESLSAEENTLHLGRLGKSRFSEIRVAVASSRNVSQGTLKFLSGDSEVEVRFAVSKNPLTPPEILESLSKDYDPSVRHKVAGNPRTPDETLTILFTDSDRRVREEVVRNVQCPITILMTAGRHGDSLLRRIAAANPRLDSGTQEILSKDEDDDVRRVLARNEALDPAIAVKMLGDRDNLVRLGLYRRQNLPEKLFLESIGKEPSWIRSSLLQEPGSNS